MIINGFNLCFVQALYIFGDIFFIVFQQLLLYGVCSTEILVADICVYNFGHTSDGGIVTEKFEKNIHLQLR